VTSIIFSVIQREISHMLLVFTKRWTEYTRDEEKREIISGSCQQRPTDDLFL